MAVAFLQEWKDAAPGTENYDAISAKLDVHNDPPPGLIAHTAGRDSNGVWRIFDVWESREHAQRFQDERLMPIVQEVMQQASGDASPPDTVDLYELHDFLHP
ncbi:MAG TPA: hypothetical protein VGH45_06945 [Solirubrobacteraceae bacterium]|jgi:hypothetical protein